MRNTMKASTIIAGLIYLTLWVLVLGTAHKAHSAEYSAYPDGFKYYDEQYRPYPPRQPHVEPRITAPKPPLIIEQFDSNGKTVECRRLAGGDHYCKELP